VSGPVENVEFIEFARKLLMPQASRTVHSHTEAHFSTASDSNTIAFRNAKLRSFTPIS